jgi:hypothetical protein
MSHPKEKPLLGGAGLSKLKVRAAYHAFNFLANLFARPFWFWEQRRSRLADRIANEGLRP